MSHSIMLIVGTRPEAIKLAPLARAFANRGLMPLAVLTGQHAQLDPATFGLAAYPLLRLHCAAKGDPRLHAETVANALAPALFGAGRPSLLIVQGDTSSALGGALAATAAGIPLAHVEAGLRSHNLAMPWPEEGNRVAIDRLFHLLFAAKEENAANLVQEGAAGEVHVTGNTAIDALFDILGALPPKGFRHGLPRLLVTCYRRENWGEAFTPIGLALIELAQRPHLQIEFVLLSNPAMAASARLLLGGHPRITLLPPVDHPAMVASIRSAHILLSDSGGLQEEAPALGIPCWCSARPPSVRKASAAATACWSAMSERPLFTMSADCSTMRRPAVRWRCQRCPSAKANRRRASPPFASDGSRASRRGTAR